MDRRFRIVAKVLAAVNIHPRQTDTNCYIIAIFGAGTNPALNKGTRNVRLSGSSVRHDVGAEGQKSSADQQRRKSMFDILQLTLILAIAATILGTALAYAWRDANRDPRVQRGRPEQN